MGASSAEPFGFELLIETATICEASQGIGIRESAVSLLAPLKRKFEFLAFFEQGSDRKGREQGHSNEDLLHNNPMQHCGAYDEHQGATPGNGGTDGDASDHENGKNSSRKA